MLCANTQFPCLVIAPPLTLFGLRGDSLGRWQPGGVSCADLVPAACPALALGCTPRRKNCTMPQVR